MTSEKRNYIFILDQNKNPLPPIHPGYARKLTKQKKAAWFLKYPNTIILKENISIQSKNKKIILGVDPGYKGTGMAIVYGDDIIAGFEILHRSEKINSRMKTRAGARRKRRSALRRRPQKSDNRASSRRKGRLAPSIKHYPETIYHRILRISTLCPVDIIAIEMNKFDLQKMVNPDIIGIEYQQGTLFEKSARSYVYERDGYKCVYCNLKFGEKEKISFELDHVIPKSKAGTDRISNLVTCCEKCNRKKRNNSLESFLKKTPEKIDKIKKQLQKPLKSATAVNIFRKTLFNEVQSFAEEKGMEVVEGNGALTSHQRSLHNFPKHHWIDAACVRELKEGEKLNLKINTILEMKCVGHGDRRVHDRCVPTVTIYLHEGDEEFKNLTVKEKKEYVENLTKKECSKKKVLRDEKGNPIPLKIEGKIQRFKSCGIIDKSISPKIPTVDGWRTGDYGNMYYPKIKKVIKNLRVTTRNSKGDKQILGEITEEHRLKFPRLREKNKKGELQETVSSKNSNLSHWIKKIHKRDGYEYNYRKDL
jgi:hypothetical protein